MVDTIVLVAAFALAAGGVVGAVVPLVPGPLLSLAGVGVYWWGTGYTEPSTLVLAGFVLVALVAVAADLLASAVGASAGGASPVVAALAGLAGLVLVPVAGPVGVLLGVAAVTFAVAYRDSGDTGASLRAAAGATVGVLASAVLQVILTLGMGLALVVVVLL